MNGVIVIDKDENMTSFDVVAKMRKICKTKKVGHTGTLDPGTRRAFFPSASVTQPARRTL